MRFRGLVFVSWCWDQRVEELLEYLENPPGTRNLYLFCQDKYTYFSLLLQIYLLLSAITNILFPLRNPKAGSLRPSLLINQQARMKLLRNRTTSSTENQSGHRFLGINKLKGFLFTDRSIHVPNSQLAAAMILSNLS